LLTSARLLETFVPIKKGGSMMFPTLELLRVAPLVLVLLGCDKVPQTEIDETRTRIDEAITAGADGFAPGSLKDAQAAFASALAEVEKERERLGGCASAPRLDRPRAGDRAAPGGSRSNKEVAARLGISAKTAETQRANIMRKLDFHSMSELVRYAIRNKMVEP
jgi:hypothetical protein